MLFPMFFFDGEREFLVEKMRMSPKQAYRTFQNNVSQKLGIPPPNQISIFLVYHRTRLMKPITAKANFAQLCRERDCFVLAVFKRSKPVLIVPPPQLFHHYLPHNVALLHHHHQHFSNVGVPRIIPMNKPVFKFCEECKIAEKNAEFHHCVKDVVVKEFRPCLFGPIGQ